MLTDKEQDIIRDMKEKLCYVCTEDFITHSRHTAKDLEKTYHLPDGTAIVMDKERAKCPEGLFKAELYGFDAFGISESCYNTINKCTNFLFHVLYRNIIISGGNTLFPGFQERLQSELLEFAPLGVKDVFVDATSDGICGAWRGGAILGLHSTFKELAMTKGEYEEGLTCYKN